MRLAHSMKPKNSHSKPVGGPEPMHIYRAANLAEAVEMATCFQRKGTYDWFRGQRRNWQPVPTIFRLTQTELKAAYKRLRRFCSWVLNTHGLERLRKDQTNIIAVAQHYGLPTTFLDFTANPGVAGYFASSEKPVEGETACIYCLNSKDLLKVWRFMRRVLPHYPKLSLVKVKVPNLWRLEAQQGAFVECGSNWIVRYPIDRIEFPASLPPSSPTPDQIYPERKSQLEQLLEHYFEAERLAQFGEEVRLRFPAAKVLRLHGPKDGYFPEYFQPIGLPELAEWKKSRLRPWLAVPVEDYRKTATGEIALRLNLRMDAKALGDAAAYGVRRALETDPGLRKRAVRWSMEPTGRLPRTLAKALERLWNGVRRQPYSTTQIAAAVGFCFQLHRMGIHVAESTEASQAIFEKCVGPSVRVEFSSWEGNPVQGFAGIEMLMAAVRPDIAKHLREEHQVHADNISVLLQLCSNHRRLFAFERFADVFVRQIVPLQSLSATSRASHFSPARLEGFGLP